MTRQPTEQLEHAIERLRACVTPWQKPSREKLVLLWGARTHGHIKALESLLERQLDWLDANVDHPRYEERFADWIANLRLYEWSCRVLDEAKAVA